MRNWIVWCLEINGSRGVGQVSVINKQSSLLLCSNKIIYLTGIVHSHLGLLRSVLEDVWRSRKLKRDVDAGDFTLQQGTKAVKRWPGEGRWPEAHACGPGVWAQRNLQGHPQPTPCPTQKTASFQLRLWFLPSPSLLSLRWRVFPRTHVTSTGKWRLQTVYQSVKLPKAFVL